MFKVGDIVKLRKGLVVGERYDGYRFYPQMNFKKGRIILVEGSVRIRIIESNGKGCLVGTIWYFPISMITHSYEDILIDYLKEVI